MKTAFIIISSAIAIISILPYIRDVYLKKTKPRVVSWFTWSLLIGIASAASFSDGQVASGVLTAITSAATLAVGALGLRYGDKNIGNFDVSCQIAAIVGLILWLIFNSPSIAIIASIAIDFVGSLPTIKHAWESPHEETIITFILGATAPLFTLLAANNHKITEIAFPIYLMLVNVVISSAIFFGPEFKHAEVK